MQHPSPDARLRDLDGFRVEIDAGRERADIILESRSLIGWLTAPLRSVRM